MSSTEKSSQPEKNLSLHPDALKVMSQVIDAIEANLDRSMLVWSASKRSWRQLEPLAA